jgi:hypothetical protein
MLLVIVRNRTRCNKCTTEGAAIMAAEGVTDADTSAGGVTDALRQ